MDDLDYTIGSFDSFIKEDIDYFTWFLQSSVGPIMGDFPISGGKVLDGIARARWALEAHLRLRVDTLQARVRDLEGAVVARKGYIQEKIAKSLARKGPMAERVGGPCHCHRKRRVNFRLR